MKTLKRIGISVIILGLFLIFMMGLGITASAETYGNFTYSVSDGEATITDCNDMGAESVSIPETINGYKVVAIGKGFLDGRRYIKHVNIPDTVTEIGTRAFANTGLTELKLPKNLIKIGARVVTGTEVKSITIPKTIEKMYENDGGYHGSFYDSNIETVVFESGITTIPLKAMHGAKKLKSVTIPDTVTKIDAQAFDYCESLKEITIPDNVTVIETRAFYDTGLTELKLPKNLIKIGARVVTGTEVKSITIPKTIEKMYENDGGYHGSFYESNIETVVFESGITTIPARALHGARKLTDVKIPETVTKISSCAFDYCESLKEITIPDNVTVIETRAFNASGLTALKLPKNIVEMGARVITGTEIKSITIPKTIEKMHENDGGYHGSFYESNIETVVFESGITNIPSRALHGARKLTDVKIPNTVTKIGSNAFDDCENLANIAIPDAVTEIGQGAFMQCISLKEIMIPDSVTTLNGEVFAYSGLENIVIPDNITVINNSQTFKGCKNLKSVTLPATREYIVTSMFEDCTSLEKIVLPSTVIAIRDHAFKNCTSLKEVTFNNVIEKIDSYAFESCDSLTTIAIPISVTTLGTGVFYDCDALTDVTFGTGLTVLPASTFEHCDALESITLPYRIASIGNNAFKDCVNFSSITIPRATTSIASNVFSYPAKLTINGVAGTYAETFAEEIGATFVDNPVNATKVTVNKTSVTLNKGQSTKLVITILPANFTDEVSWKSSDTNIATIAEDGTLTAKNLGTATIKISVGNVSTSCKVTVLQPVTSVTIDKSSVTMQALDTYQLKLSVDPNNAANKTVKWSSSAEDIASVDKNGLVTAHKKGEATIRADAQDGSGRYDTCKIIVSNNGVITTDVTKIQSSHNYPVNCTDFWQYTYAGAANLQVTFDSRTNVEDGFDYIYIFNKNGVKIGTYTGTELAGKTITISGDTIRIQIVSDDSGTEWGFKVTSVKTHTHSYKTITTKATPAKNGKIENKCSGCGDVKSTTVIYYPKTITLSATQYTYSGSAKAPSVTVKDSNNKTLKKDTDYTVKYASAKTNAGTYPVTITFKGNYEGTKTLNYKIVPDSSSKKITLSATKYTYSGSAKAPSVTVKTSNGTTLKKDTDYTVAYSTGKTKVGKYAVTVTFKGNYSGTQTLYYLILPSKTSKITPTRTSTTIKATWVAVTGASGYKVELLSSGNSVLKKVNTTNLTYTFTGLTGGTDYKIRVTAYKTIKNVNEYSLSSTTLSTSTTFATPPFTVTSTTKGKANFSWGNISGETGYQVYCATSRNGTYSKVGTYVANSTSGSKSSLTSGKTYYFKIRAYKKVGDTVIYSGWSTVQSVKIK